MKHLESVEGQIGTLVEQGSSETVQHAFNLHRDRVAISRLCSDIEYLMETHYKKKLVKNEKVMDEQRGYDLATVSDLVLLLHHKAFVGPMDGSFFDGYALPLMKVRASDDPTQSQIEALDPGILDRTVDLTRSKDINLKDLKIINRRDEYALDADDV